MFEKMILFLVFLLLLCLLVLRLSLFETNVKKNISFEIQKNIKFVRMNQLSMSFDEHRDVNYFQFDPKTVVTDLQKAIPELDLVGLVHSKKW